MKNRSILLIFLAATSWAPAQELRIGDNRETTLSTLGKPVGEIKLKEKMLLLYPKGEVVLKDDAVIEIDLMTEAEYQEEQARKKQQREEWLAQKARMAEAHAKEGKAIRTAKRSSNAFAALPAKDRVDYWRSFQARYPSVDVSEDLASALESYQTELTELKAQQRIAQLEARVAKAEQEAAAARLETQRLKEETERKQRSKRYGLRYYYDPVVQPRYIHRPPTITIYQNGQKRTIHCKDPDYWKYRNGHSDHTSHRMAQTINTGTSQ